MLKLLYECLFLQEINLDESQEVLKDKYLADNLLMREYQDTVYIYFLWTADYFEIPRAYFQIAREFDVYCGGNLEERYTPQGPAEIFLSELYNTHRGILNKTSVLEPLSRILSIGSQEFRKFLVDRLEISLDPIQYITLAKTYEI